MVRFSNKRLACHVEVRDLRMSSCACQVPVPAPSANRRDTFPPPQTISREQRIHETVLLSFTSTVFGKTVQLLQLSPREWRKLFHWLDVSGLALYLLDRFIQLELLDELPKSVVDDWQQRMKNNAERTRGLLDESVAIQREFQKASLCYSVMKGISLSPLSVPRPELRHQFDLDYLIAEESAPEARRILERRGYQMYAISGQTWEFKINETPNVSVKDLYKDLPYRSVELHLEANTAAQVSRLDRVQYREMLGITMPVLSPVDLFLGQAMHAFKDVSGAFCRTAHLLEFYRHVLAKREDDVFWRDLRARAEDNRRTCLGIGVVTYLITSIMGNFAPEALTAWTVDLLPPSVSLWVDLYGRRTVFGKHPGTKLYLLLLRELEVVDVSTIRPVKKSLWPSRLPPTVIRASADETLSTCIARYRVQARFIFSRLCFHIAEGLRYAIESYRWRRHLGAC
jgi:hypothetical protein